jgi:hypothetical protein
MKKVNFILACTILGVAVGNFVVTLLSMLRND